MIGRFDVAVNATKMSRTPVADAVMGLGSWVPARHDARPIVDGDQVTDDGVLRAKEDPDAPVRVARDQVRLSRVVDAIAAGSDQVVISILESTPPVGYG